MKFICESCDREIVSKEDRITHFNQGLCATCAASLEQAMSEDHDEELELAYA